MPMRSQSRAVLHRFGVTPNAGPTPFLGFVATGALVPHNSNGNAAINTRSVHRSVVAISAIRIVPTANFDGAAAPESARGNGASATVKVAVEYPAGTFTRITFPAPVQSGGDPNTGLIPAADIIESDLVTLATPIPANTDFWVRQFYQNANGLWFSQGFSGSTGLAGANSGAVGGDLSGGGTFTDNMAANGLNMPPTAIIGMTTSASVIGMGDSLAWNFGSGNTFTGDGRDGIIFHNFPANTYAFLNLAHPGLQLTTQVAGNSATSKLYQYASHFLIQDGVNDIFVNSQSAAQTSANMTALIASLPAGKKYTITTLTPESSTTDSFATTANQTTDARNSVRVTYNGLVRAGSISGVNNGFFEVSDGVENVRDDGKWKVDGTASKYTADGVHSTDFANGNIATTGGITSAILAARLVYP